MRMVVAGAAAAMALLASTGARAADALLDLRNPKNVAAALQATGYKADMKTATDGKPFIESAANGSGFTIEFYDCDATKTSCTSYQFSSWWKKEPFFTPALANEWNLNNRFLKVVIGAEGNLDEFADASAVGMTTQANFADLVQWYIDGDRSLTKFLETKRGGPAK